ncbi:RNA-binding protein [Microsporum canis CBS 113480]|uniref:RNA-binding protein n=1 Tax=Arthroderma otae (strain ATCC MYA-4605 / CBS 113480) TaxID=554155 RepID=C5G0E0_ARTOC|nr:RNA-binding protein [Microsporum canis CBS 113480]EEQ35593.1 RNA-binding protein [Microsporum canis CBS 113480]
MAYRGPEGRYADRGRPRYGERHPRSPSPPDSRQRYDSPGDSYYAQDARTADRRRENSADDYRDKGREPYRQSSRSPPRYYRGRDAGYRDRDREGYRSPPSYDMRYSRSRSHSRTRSRTRSRSRSYSRSRSKGRRHARPLRHYGTESREIMMEGLPVDMTEEDVTSELAQHYHIRGLEDVRVIRDRQTKMSRQLAFIRFPTIDDSREFLEGNFPAIYLYGKAGADGQGAKVRIAYSREREDRNRARGDGEWTCINCSIVNFAGRQRCFRCQASKPDAALLPVEETVKVANNGDNDVSTDGTPSQFLLFRGLESSVTEEMLAKGVAKLCKQTKPGAASTQPGSSGVGGAAKKGAKVASTTGDSNLGARDGSICRVLLRNSTARRRHERSKVQGNSTQKPARAATHGRDGEKEKKRKKGDAGAGGAAGSATKKIAMASHLQFWSNRHAELHGLDRRSAETGDGDHSKEPCSVAARSQSQSQPSSLQLQPLQQHQHQQKQPHLQGQQSYADLNRLCCYLCMREFKSEAHVHQHERLSQLHRENLQDETLKAKALAKLAKKRMPTDQTEYRDRAKERRRVFGSSKIKKREAEAGRQSEGEQASAAAAPAALSKGAALLGKMGWSAGSGLGAEGTGMKQPVPTDLYVQGVGLGAQGSKIGDAVREAGRSTRGRYDEFLEKTREHARERYERMKNEQG